MAGQLNLRLKLKYVLGYLNFTVDANVFAILGKSYYLKLSLLIARIS